MDCERETHENVSYLSFCESYKGFFLWKNFCESSKISHIVNKIWAVFPLNTIRLVNVCKYNLRIIIMLFDARNNKLKEKGTTPFPGLLYFTLDP